MLNLARAVQGVGGAIMFATSLALIARRSSAADRGTAFGIYGAVIGGAVAIGPAHRRRHHQRHRLALDLLRQRPDRRRRRSSSRSPRSPSRRTPRPRRIDWVGFVTFSVSLFCLVFALVRGNDLGWGSTTIVGLLVASAVLMVAFFVNEPRTGDPMLDLGLFRIPAFVGHLRRGLHAGGLHLRHVPVPDPLHPGRPGLRPTGRRPPLPPPDAGHLLRRLLRRSPDRAGARRACCSASGCSS